MTAEVEINPFRPDGELSKEVDDILKNSTISRNTIIINDPALRCPNGTAASVEGIVSNNIHTKYAGSPFKSQTSNGLSVTDGPPHPPGPVTCEVVSQHIQPIQSPATFHSGQVEHVNIKSSRKPTKCCVIQ
ncbi:hypothetical protein EWB00_004120 [Schistosoma japonicum]|uniref:SJCHGC04876 protein n=1 Tax=Schistosoma japonicum TaxID=6182 RepID=Q5DHA9_SCHJA|nr:SJCHGC04876 protein [Schistosoma japonicum]KAH8867479.1 hypothetical protein KSF78_0003707 [Schistosoma japonicum]KAH8867480.1 hypothetical protein KSF78_0003707 [Schistosoma japonicum]KAH8867481.1 hypothetical protein KSF78_0003707 [Schistosoma japonicum]KAH8867482.1 hypothetical protein KSF78_0003707 [Schistosoma japonicum]